VTTQATFRARLRTLLDDAAVAIWTDAELNDHIDEALRLLSRSTPNEETSTIATTAGNRDVSISSLTDLIRIRAAEYPTGNFPETFVPFRVWGLTLTLLGSDVPDGSNVRLFWESTHLVADGTLPTTHDTAVLRAAAALACDQQQADTTNAINTGGAFAPRDWRALSAQHWAAYHAQAVPRAGVRVAYLYQPAAPISTETRDPGP